MNLGGAVLGGMVQQANTEQELGVKRGNLALQMQQLAGQRLAATYDQAQQIVSQLPSDADRPSVQQTLGALKQDAMALAHGAGMNPQTAGMRFDALITTTPTIQTAAQQKGGAQSTQDIASTGGAAVKAGVVTGATEAAKAPYTPVVIGPGASAVPATAVLGGPAPAAPSVPAPGPTGAPAGGPPPVTYGPAGLPLNNASSAPGAAPGIVRNAAGGLTNTTNPAMVNLTNGNQSSYLEKMGGAVADFIGEKQKSVGGYQDALNAIAQLKPTLLTTKTGGATATEAVADLNKFGARFGIDVNKYLPQGWQVDPTKYDVANKSITQLATAFAKGNFPNRITNNDMQIAIAATPNFGNTPEANAELLGNLESVAKLRLAEAKFYAVREAQIREAGSVPDWRIQYDWQNTLQNMKGVSPALKAAFSSSDSLGAQPSPDVVVPPTSGAAPGGGPGVSGSLGTPPPTGTPPVIDPNAARMELRRRGIIK